MKVGSSEQVISVCLGTAKSRVYTPKLPFFLITGGGRGRGHILGRARLVSLLPSIMVIPKRMV